MVRCLIAIAAVVVLAGCGAWPRPSLPVAHHRDLGDGEHWLPDARWTDADGQRYLCAGVGLDGEFRLHGSPDDPRFAWFADPVGRRQDIGWEADRSARFTPDLEILDDNGQVIAREGSRVVGGCWTAEPGVMWIELEPLPCGPSQCPRIEARVPIHPTVTPPGDRERRLG